MTDFVESPLSLATLDDAGRALLFTEARTANSFAATPVTDSELAGIWDLARWAPTSANSQPLRVLYVHAGSARERLVEHMSDGNKGKTLSAPAVAVLAVDTQFHDHFPVVLPFRPGLKDVFEANEALRTSTGRFNATLQAAYFIISVRAHGLAAGPMAGFDAAGIDLEFFTEERWESILVVNIGHPGLDPWMGRLPRLGQDDVVHWV